MVPLHAPTLDPRTKWAMAVGTALSVSNLYLLQPLTATVARDLGAGEGVVGQAVTLGQVGYTVGLVLVVPLGDLVERRALVVKTLVASVGALVLMGVAPSAFLLGVAAFLVGLATVTPQLLVPFAAALSRPEERGRTVGFVMAGLLLGILLARTVSGGLVGLVGWRGVFFGAAGTMLILSFVLFRMLPSSRNPDPPAGYRPLMLSLWGIVRREPALRRAMFTGACGFASFSAWWATLTFLLEREPFRAGPEIAGLFGLAGAAGAVAASFAGRWGDQGHPRRVIQVSLVLILVGWGVAWVGRGSYWGLGAAVLLIDFGVQASHVSNQSRIYALAAEARSRVNTAYMGAYFVGGALGSFLGVAAWQAFGWAGVIAVGLLGPVAALVAERSEV